MRTDIIALLTLNRVNSFAASKQSIHSNRLFSLTNVCLQDSAKPAAREEIGPQICGHVDTLEGRHTGIFFVLL